MKLLNYDFYDLQALIVFFREKSDCVSEYAGAIEQIISCLENKKPEKMIKSVVKQMKRKG